MKIRGGQVAVSAAQGELWRQLAIYGEKHPKVLQSADGLESARAALQAAMSTGNGGPDAHVTDEGIKLAIPNRTPTSPKGFVILGMSFIVSLLAGIGLAVWRDRLGFEPRRLLLGLVSSGSRSGQHVATGLIGRSASFGAPLRASVACGMITGDFNSDGRLDLVGGNSLLLGRGDGTFLPSRVIGPNGISPRAVTAGDFNGDRKPDLVFYSGPTSWEEETAPATMHVMLGAGDGTFTTSWTQENLPPVLGVTTVADFNRDGHADLAVTDGRGGLLTFLGQGNGSFQTAKKTVNNVHACCPLRARIVTRARIVSCT
jgi:hypothetical protein